MTTADRQLPQRATRDVAGSTSDEHAELGAWRLTWNPDFGEPDWPGHTYSPEDDDLPGDYPDAADVEALVEWGRRHFGP